MYHFELVDLWSKALGTIASLPEHQRRAVIEMRLLHRTADEAAKTLGIAPGAVRVNVHRGMQKVRAWLREQESGDYAPKTKPATVSRPSVITDEREPFVR